jgi:transglutaminase-like putative cysteine protease
MKSALLLTLVLLTCAPAAAAADKEKELWKPLAPSDLAPSKPVVETDADAEALFWEVVIDDSPMWEVSLSHYVRIKVFDERGRDAQSKVELPYYGDGKIKEIAARVNRPDGTVVELKKEDIFDRTVVKMSGLRVKVKSFALPGVEPGSVVEYRWREVRPGSADGLRLDFQRDIPVRSVTYHFKPDFSTRYRAINMGDARFEKDPEMEGFWRLSQTNMPAFREEPRMPPEAAVRSWVFVYTSFNTKSDAGQYWQDAGRGYYASFEPAFKLSDEVRAAAAAAVAGAKNDGEKLERLYDFCRLKIKNVNDDASGLTAGERAKLKENKTPADTLKRAQGTGGDINSLFVALARAAGFDARLAFSGNNADFFFDRSYMHWSFLHSALIAVRLGDGWQLLSPASAYTPYGMKPWPVEAQDVLVTDPKLPFWVRSVAAGPEKSLERRSGKFKLSEDGTLEGEVRIEYTGHLGADLKESNDDDSPAEREKAVVEAWKAQMGAEVTGLRVENVSDPVKPFAYAFHVRVPGYAQRTGKRLFFQPAFFQKGLAPRFPQATRRHEVYFHHPWSEDDRVEVELPEGFALDNAESPAPLSADALSRYEPAAGVSKDGRTLVYTRRFYFGQGGDQMLRFPAGSYASLKGYFDEVSKHDAHTIALRQGAASASKD